MSYLKYKLLIFALAVMGSCSACQPKPATVNGYQFSAEIRPASGTPKGRLYFIHGYYQTIADAKGAPYSNIADAAHEAGYEVVYIEWPAAGATRLRSPDFGHDGGKTYVRSFQYYMKELNESLPAVPRTLIGGFSFGGLHAVWAQEVIPADAVFSAMSLVVISRIDEFRGVDTSWSDMPSRTLPNNFWLSYGTEDDRVKGTMVLDDFPGASFLHPYDSGHVMIPQQITDLVSWVHENK